MKEVESQRYVFDNQAEVILQRVKQRQENQAPRYLNEKELRLLRKITESNVRDRTIVETLVGTDLHGR